MFKFIHAADLHLDSPLCGLERYDGAPVDAIRQATRRALENLVDLALTQKVAFVVLAGDLYDGDWKEFRTGLFFIAQMVKLREAQVPVYVIAGNHDAANKMTRRLPLPENVHFFSPDAPQTIRLEACDVAIHGQSFAQAAVLENLAAAYPAADPGLFNIGLLHTAATGREGHQSYAPCTLDDLRGKQYDYWALGHIHKREILCNDPPIVFPGNMQGRHIRETGPKGCTLVTVDDRRRPRLETCWLDVFRWEHFVMPAVDLETGDDLVEAVRGRLEQAIAAADDRPLAARIEIRGRSPVHRLLAAEPVRWTNDLRAVAQDVGSGNVWIEKVALRTQPPTANGEALEGPIRELVQWIGELRSQPDQLQALRGELGDLLDKLPAELKEGEASLGLDQADTLRELLDQVEQMLVHQLIDRPASEAEA